MNERLRKTPKDIKNSEVRCKGDSCDVLEEGIKVRVDEAYLEDESSPDGASAIATVVSEPSDTEELVQIQYEDGSMDYLGQEWLEPIKGSKKSTGGSMKTGREAGENWEVKESSVGEKEGWHFTNHTNFTSALYTTKGEAEKALKKYLDTGKFDFYGSAEMATGGILGKDFQQHYAMHGALFGGSYFSDKMSVGGFVAGALLGGVGGYVMRDKITKKKEDIKSKVTKRLQEMQNKLHGKQIKKYLLLAGIPSQIRVSMDNKEAYFYNEKQKTWEKVSEYDFQALRSRVNYKELGNDGNFTYYEFQAKI